MPTVLDCDLLTKAADNLDLEGQRYWGRAQRWAKGGPDREGGDATAYESWDRLRLVSNALRKIVTQTRRGRPPRGASRS